MVRWQVLACGRRRSTSLAVRQWSLPNLPQGSPLLRGTARIQQVERASVIAAVTSNSNVVSALNAKSSADATTDIGSSPRCPAPTAYSARSYARRSATGVTLTRTPTTSKERGFGGFPTPVELAGMAFKRMAPKLNRQLTRSMTMPRTSTFASAHSGGAETTNGRSAPYLTFDATVSRNSRFVELSEHQREELGGIEYRAIDMLCTLVPAYWLFVVFLFIVMVAPWLATRSAAAKFYQVRATQAPHEPDSTWFWFFNVVSAFSNTGMSLIDTSMINLADQYFMLIPLGTLILAGNTAFPILFRFMIWFLSRIVPSTSRTYETLRFLLDHPRRCFVYLFPSAQTWFLLFVLAVLK